MAKKKVTINNVGPISHAEIELKPGINLLRGRNETGKSTAIRAVQALTSDAAMETLTPKDGTPVGFVQCGAMTLEIGRRVKRSGFAEISSIKDPTDIDVLVDPGVKGDESRMRYRIRALLAITGQQISKQDFVDTLPAAVHDILEDKVEFTPDPLESAKRVKRAIEQYAREYEREADAKNGEILEVIRSMPECPEVMQFTEEQLKAELESWVRRKIELETETRLAAEVAAQVQAAQQQATGLSTTEQELRTLLTLKEEADTSLRDRQQRLIAAQQARDEAQAALDRAERACDNAHQESVAIEQRVKDTTKTVERLREMKNIAERGIPQPPDASEFGIIETERNRVLQLMDMVKAKKKKEEAQGRVALMRDQHTAFAQQAAVHRDAAQQVYDVLSKKLNAPGLKIKDGEFVLDEPGREGELFDRLSDGKRYQVAIRIATKALRAQFGPEDMLTIGIQQKAWEGLDESNQALIAQTAIEENVAIVAAQHSMGPLSVE